MRDGSGTPGRLEDFLQRGVMSMEEASLPEI